MEDIMLKVERLIDGINGEDPGGARLYMAQLRDREAESLLQCFQELVSGDGIYSPHNSSEFYGGAGLHFNVSSSSSGSSSLTYSVPPSEFLKVLLEGNLTRLRSFHAALQAMGRGNLRGRAASLCLSELRMCMVAGTAPPGSQSSSTASNSVIAADIHHRDDGASNILGYGDDSAFGRAAAVGAVANQTVDHSGHLLRQQLPPLRLHQLREIADVCLSFIFDPDLTSTTATDGHQRRRRATGCSYYGEHTAADRNNGRVMMLDALPAVLGACCAAAAAEEHGFYSNSSDSENESDEDEDDMAADTMARAVDSPAEDFGPAAACSGRTNDNSRKGKGKKNPTRSDHHSVIGGRGKGGHRVTRQHQGQRHRNGDVSVAAGVGRRRVRATAGGQGRGDNFLPKRGAEVVVEITNALLDKPWGPQSALPLLRMFGEISDLVEALDKSCADHDGHVGIAVELEADQRGRGWGRDSERWIEDGASAHGRKTGVWTGVRSRLLECVWTGGLDGADFTGVLQQVCMLCEADIRRNFEQKDCRPRCYLRQDKNGVISCSDDATIRTVATAEGACVGKRGNNKDRQQSRETTRPQGIGDNNCSSGDIDGDWLSCLRWLYAAVPPDSLSTVELVLEQTLHQMPDVAESLLDSILRQRVVGDGGGGAGKRSSRDTELTRSNVTVPRTTVDTPQLSRHRSTRPSKGHDIGKHKRTPGLSSNPRAGEGAYSAHDSNSSTHDLALLLLLLREAAPLRACSLPLLPDGADRGRRAEDGVRFLLLSAARRDPEYSWCDDNSNGSCRRNSGGVVREGRAGARASVRAMVKGVLWREAGWVGGGAGSTGGAVGGRGGDVGDGCEDEVESSSVASERASQLLELALRWLEECDEVRDGSGGGVDCIIGMDELAADTICTVFDAVPGARPRLLRSLLSGVVDRSQGGAVCAESYLFAWETVMAQEGRLHCRRLAPHSQVVSDVLGRLTLLPRDRARRVLQSMLPLADACRSHASALISLHRKCATQTGSKGRRLALHGVSCILVWNARRGTAAGVARDGCLNEDGVQEDLIAMFRRAMEGGLQTAARAEALHFLASNLFARPSFARTATSGNLTVTHPVSLAGAATGVPARGIGMAATAAATVAGVNVRILSGLRQILADRLSRFLVHKDDILACDGALDGGNGSSTGERHGYSRKYGAGDDAGYLSVVDRGKSKGKKRARASRGGRYQFAPMSLLEHRQHSSTYSIDRGGNGAAGGGGRVLFNGGGNSVAGSNCGNAYRGGGGGGWEGIITRDAIGQLLRCCWALIPSGDDAVNTGGLQWPHGRMTTGAAGVGPVQRSSGIPLQPVSEQRAEAEVVARAMLGSGSLSWLERGGREQATGGNGASTRSFTGGEVKAGSLEGEALLAVVEFLASGGIMETVRVSPPAPEQAPGCADNADGKGQRDQDRHSFRVAGHPPPCHPGMVGPLPALSIVVTVAEAMVDCLLNTVTPSPSFLSSHRSPPSREHSTRPLSPTRIGAYTRSGNNTLKDRVAGTTHRGTITENSNRLTQQQSQQHSSLIFWAAIDTFTLLAAAGRAAEGLRTAAGSGGGGSGGSAGSLKQSKFRPPQGLSAVLASLTAEAVGFSHRGAGTSCFEGTEDGEDCDDRARGSGGPGRTGGGVIGGFGDEGNNSRITGSFGVPAPLFSTYSAFAFAKQFLYWAGCKKECEGEEERGRGGRSVPSVDVNAVMQSVGEGWDGGVGVWLGLTHSVRALAQSLESVMKDGHHSIDQVGMWQHNEGSGGGMGTPEAGQAGTNECPTVESVAHVIFELRRVVGSPGAAAFDFDGSTNAATQLSSASTGGPWTPKSWATVHGSGEAVEPAHGATGDDLGNPGSGLSPRPPPGAMVTGFLKHMSQRWKAHLDWGVADLVAPRRASPRLERSRGRRRCVFYDESEDGIGQRGGCGIGGADIPQGLRDETIDLFGGLRGELLRAERLAVLALLRGPVSTRTSRLWVVRAALAASRTVSALATDSDLAFAAHSGRQIGEGRPYTAGAAVSNDGGSGGEEPETGSGSARIAVAAAAGDNASANAIIKWPLRSRGRRSAADGRRAGQCQGSEGYVSGSGNDGGNPSDSHGGVVEGDGDCCRTGEGREREEEELGEGLGMLCRHTALELREALENGLSVKLTQAYLDQIELFGNAALEHRRRAKGGDGIPQGARQQGARMTAAVVVAAAGQFPSDDAKVGAKDENTEQGSVHDAGEVLLSILTCHCITQSSLFQRLIRGAVQFEGIGVRRFGRRRLSHCNQNAPVARHMVPKPPQDRSSRLLLHSIRWIRKRQGGSNARGGRGRSRRSADITHDIEEESAEEAAVGAGCGGGRDGSRSTGGGRFEGGNCTNNVREASCKTETAEDYDDSVDGAYSSQPEAVIMASPRECYTVLTRAVATYEAALLASLGSFGGSMPGRGSGVLPGGSDSASSLGGDYFDQEEVSEVLCVVAGALREFFSTSSTGLSCTTSTVTVLRAQNHGESCSSRHADAIGNDNIAAAAELPGVDEANLAATVSADEVYSAVSVSKRKADELCTSDEAVREEMKKTPAPDRRAVVTSLPEAVKLRLMQTLERFYLTGRAVSLVASAALTTPPPPTAVQWTGKRLPELKHDAEVESPTAPDADHVPIPSSPTPATSAPPPSKRRRHDTREESVVKPADQAAGTGRPTRAARTRSLSRRVSGGCCAPVLAATGAVAVEEERKDSAEHPEVPRIPPTTRSEILCEKVNNGDNKASVGVVISHDVKSLGCKGLENGDSAADHIVQLLARVGLGEAGGWMEEGGSMAEATRRLLEAVLPAAVMASSKCLELMSLVRAWAEAERAQDRRTGDDPCRKKASTLLFKMDRCELEIGKAARKAREYLDNFQRMDNSGKLDAHGEQDSADKVSGSHPRDCKTGGVGGRRPGGNSSGIKQGGSSRAKDCDKSRSGGVRTVGGWETGGGACKIAKVNNACDHRLERVLGALVRGADTLAASRRDSAASIRSGCRSTGARKKRTSRGRGSGGGEGAGVASNAGSMPQRQGRSSRSGQESVADGGQEGDNSHEDRDSEDSVGSQRDSHASADENIGDGGAFASGFLSGGRRGRKGSRRAARVRSRNTVIDGWLHESDEGHVNGADAFVDLEDFIVG